MKNEEKVLDHDYDGIQELDNPLPRWWLLMFYATIVFAPLYIAYYHIGDGKGPDQSLAGDLDTVRGLQKSSAPPAENLDETALAALAADSGKMQVGHEIFELKCASCHGVKGEGGIGPNLTDTFWIHGDGSLSANYKTISTGVLEKGMPAWATMIKPEELNLVVAYVKTLEGTNPNNGKVPQGTEIKRN